MPSLQLKLEQDNTRYTMPQLIQLRRQMLRFARSLPPGPERNGRRQIAASLRSLVRNTKWLAAHTIEAPVKEYRVYTVDTESHFIKTIKLDCPDDASATESARQFIDGLDIKLWQLDRKVATKSIVWQTWPAMSVPGLQTRLRETPEQKSHLKT